VREGCVAGVLARTGDGVTLDDDVDDCAGVSRIVGGIAIQGRACTACFAGKM